MYFFSPATVDKTPNNEEGQRGTERSGLREHDKKNRVLCKHIALHKAAVLKGNSLRKHNEKILHGRDKRFRGTQPVTVTRFRK